MSLSAPFPWFGGKRRVAPNVWAAVGDVEHYVEPFAGSLAVLLGRPQDHQHRVETVNDLDAFLVNFWRALQHEPNVVASYANNPVNETDLIARHAWLVSTGAERLARLSGDPDYYDAKTAGWWAWGIACWIGSSWCKGVGPWQVENGKLVKRTTRNKPGVRRARIHLGDPGHGVNRSQISTKVVPNSTETGEMEISAYLSGLAERLRYVRVCQGDWRRVLTPGALSYGKTVGIFLDPPYATDLRYGEAYNTDQIDGAKISGEVRNWCLENENNSRYRIVLAGYEGEHDMPKNWLETKWASGRSFASSSDKTPNLENRHKERLWFSPSCLRANDNLQLFSN